MTDSRKKDVVNPIAVAVTGAAIGAGVAIAGAVALKDEKNRKKIKGILNDLKDRGEDVQDDLKKEAKERTEEIKEKVEGNTDKIEDKKTSKAS